MKRALFAAAALALSATPTLAQGPCAPVAAVLSLLEKNAGEVPAANGRDERGYIAVLTLAPGGSYSVLAVRPDGIACLLSTGAGWSATAPKPPGKES